MDLKIKKDLFFLFLCFHTFIIIDTHFYGILFIDNRGDKMNIGIAADHRGYRLKQKLLKYLTHLGYDTKDLGTTSRDAVDYPDFAFALGNAVINQEIDLGIAICGSGIGISIACNKVKGIRCAKVDSILEAKLARLDNNANVLALNGSMPVYKAKDLVDAFLKTEFSNFERHQKRIDKITDYELSKKRSHKSKKEEETGNEC